MLDGRFCGAGVGYLPNQTRARAPAVRLDDRPPPDDRHPRATAPAAAAPPHRTDRATTGAATPTRAAPCAALANTRTPQGARDRGGGRVTARGRGWRAGPKAFGGMRAKGMSGGGVARERGRRKKGVVESIVRVTEGGEYDPPYFVESLLRYKRELQADPTV